MANGAGLRILSLVVRAFKSHPLHHFPAFLRNKISGPDPIRPC